MLLWEHLWTMEQWELRKSRLHTDSSQGPTVIWAYDVILPILCFFCFDIGITTWTTALIDHLPQELVDVFLGHPVHGTHLQPNLRHKWAMQSEMWNAMFSNVFAMFLHLNNPAGKSLPDGETCTAVHPLFALNKTTMIWSRCSSSSSSQSRS